MKTQSSLEVPKQVRSASIDEIQLEAKRNQEHVVDDKDGGAGGGPMGFLKVPQFVNQRSKSFDSGGSEDSAMYLEVPRRFQRRRSSGDKIAMCFHCACVEEFLRLQAADQSEDLVQDHHNQARSLSYSDTSSSDWDDDDDISSKDDSIEVNTPNTQCSIRVTLSPNSPSSPSPECLRGEEGVPGSPPIRRRSITSPKLARQEAFFVTEPGTNSLENISDVTSEASDAVSVGSCSESGVGLIVSEIYLKVPELKRDRAASVDSCFSKVSSSNKTEELDQVLTLQVPQVTLRSRSVDIVLPTDEQARYKALAMASTPSYAPAVKG
jgi:diacylglycerol kinase (ATP)